MFKLKTQTLLVVAPHPDDEVIGCGGLINKITENGGRVYVLYLTVGETRDFSKRGYSGLEERRKELEEVSKFLKFDGFDLAFEGNDYHLKLDILGQKALMDVIERESPVSIERVKPTIIAFPSPASYNQDHRIAAVAAHAATRPAQADSKHFVSTVLAYEEPADVWSWQERIEPNFFVPLSKHELLIKIAALKIYKSQLRTFPNLRSIDLVRELAVLRGAEVGRELAEGFCQFRGIW